jgi:hypothetical protein
MALASIALAFAATVGGALAQQLSQSVAGGRNIQAQPKEK